MQYAEGKPGRIFLLRIDHGEDLVGTLHEFIIGHGINCGYIRFIGALLSGEIVTGPEKPVLPPDPHFESFSGGWEVVGMATITPGEDGPRLHLHASIGRGNQVLTGCLRGTITTYIIVEAVITEITGIEMHMEQDPVTGLVLPVMPEGSRHL
ncbi:MAG TPA: PPC domain-containing DNA-binding protein [Methanoregulaceae archaeon]|nr:PPC domain-containing DNA-binding protein [Methanoregulaceae archaeon]